MPYLKDGRTGYQPADTSLTAAISMTGHTETYRKAVLKALIDHGPMTADEIGARLNVSILTIRPRTTELKDAGKIIDTGQRRKTPSGRPSIVWQAKESDQ